MSAVVDFAKSANLSVKVSPNSARSMRESVVFWPRHWDAQVLTKSSAISLPSESVGMPVSDESFVSQSV